MAASDGSQGTIRGRLVSEYRPLSRKSFVAALARLLTPASRRDVAGPFDATPGRKLSPQQEECIPIPHEWRSVLLEEAATFHYYGKPCHCSAATRLRQLDAADDLEMLGRYASAVCGFQDSRLQSALSAVLARRTPKNWRTKPDPAVVPYIAGSARRFLQNDDRDAENAGRWTDAQRREAADRRQTYSTVTHRSKRGGTRTSATTVLWRGCDKLEREAAENMARACCLYAAKAAGLEGVELDVMRRLASLLSVDTKEPGRVDPNVLNRAARQAMPGSGVKIYEKRRQVVERIQGRMAAAIASGRFDSPRLNPSDPRIVSALGERERRMLGLSENNSSESALKRPSRPVL